MIWTMDLRRSWSRLGMVWVAADGTDCFDVILLVLLLYLFLLLFRFVFPVALLISR
jgi:hypothetical protein